MGASSQLIERECVKALRSFQKESKAKSRRQNGMNLL
jgi:hypothetical protein